jgi:hypothetical protein
MQGALKTTDFDLKQKVLQLVIDRVTVDDQQLTIRHIIPTGPIRLQTGQSGPGRPSGTDPIPSIFKVPVDTVKIYSRQ